MKAVLSPTLGPADLLKVAEIETPVVPDDGVLVRVHAASINPVEWQLWRRGSADTSPHACRTGLVT